MVQLYRQIFRVICWVHKDPDKTEMDVYGIQKEFRWREPWGAPVMGLQPNHSLLLVSQGQLFITIKSSDGTRTDGLPCILWQSMCKVWLGMKSYNVCNLPYVTQPVTEEVSSSNWPTDTEQWFSQSFHHKHFCAPFVYWRICDGNLQCTQFWSFLVTGKRHWNVHYYFFHACRTTKRKLWRSQTPSNLLCTHDLYLSF